MCSKILNMAGSWSDSVSDEETDVSDPDSLYDEDVDVNGKTADKRQKRRDSSSASSCHFTTSPGSSLSSSSTPSRIREPISKSFRKKIPSRKESDRSKPSVVDINPALVDITNTLKRVVKRLDKQDSQLKSLEQKITTTSTYSSSTSSGSKSREKVPSVVRVSPLCVRHAYYYCVGHASLQ